MPFPASHTSLPFVLYECQSLGQSLKQFAQSAVTTLQTQSVDSDWVFQFVERFYALGAALNTWRTAPGLNEYALANIKGSPTYAGVFTDDMDATIAAGQVVINWVVTNFPKDSTAGYVLSHTLNANGSRTPRTFTIAQTNGLRTALANFIDTIG